MNTNLKYHLGYIRFMLIHADCSFNNHNNNNNDKNYYYYNKIVQKFYE